VSGEHRAKRWTLSIEGNTLTASTSATVYTVVLGTAYQPRASATSESPRVATAFLDGGARIYSRSAPHGKGGGGNRTLSSIDSFVHTYEVPRRSLRHEVSDVGSPPDLAGLTATAALVARVAAVEAIVRRIAAELGVVIDQEAKP
jgi:hypothetical protein